MGTLKSTVHVVNPDDPEGPRVIVMKGEEVPDWAEVDEALIEEPPPKPTPTPKPKPRKAKAAPASKPPEDEPDKAA